MINYGVKYGRDIIEKVINFIFLLIIHLTLLTLLTRGSWSALKSRQSLQQVTGSQIIGQNYPVNDKP